MTRVHGHRGAATVAGVLALALVAAGCGRSGHPSDATVRAQIARELDLTPTQSTCLWKYLVREVPRATIEQIPTRGFTVIASAHWGAYVEGALTCVLYPQMTGHQPVPGAS